MYPVAPVLDKRYVSVSILLCSVDVHDCSQEDFWGGHRVGGSISDALQCN